MRKLTLEGWITKARQVHGNRYDYSRVVYVNGQTKVKIICREHGEFEQIPNSHLLGWNCKKCGNEKCSETRRETTDDFIRKACAKHGDRYDYSKVNYQGNKTKVIIICRIHGEFEQLPADHIYGKNCRKCTGCAKSNTEEYVQKARLIHGDRYDYSKTVYVRKGEKVIIICRVHGDFEQETSSHLGGCGCPQCRNSLGEEAVAVYLASRGIRFEREKRFETCCDNKQLPFDFYLLDYDALIEVDGIQHFKSIDFFGGDESLTTQIRRDCIKDQWVITVEKKLLRIAYVDINMIDVIFESFMNNLDELMGKNRIAGSEFYDTHNRGYVTV